MRIFTQIIAKILPTGKNTPPNGGTVRERLEQLDSFSRLEFLASSLLLVVQFLGIGDGLCEEDKKRMFVGLKIDYEMIKHRFRFDGLFDVKTMTTLMFLSSVDGEVYENLEIGIDDDLLPSPVQDALMLGVDLIVDPNRNPYPDGLDVSDFCVGVSLDGSRWGYRFGCGDNVCVPMNLCFSDGEDCV